MLRVLLRDWQFLASATVVCAIVLTGLIGPMFVRDPQGFHGLPNQPPSRKFPLGTDPFGRDVLAQVVVGIRTSLYVGAFAGLIGVCIGVAIGVIGGYIKGWVGEVLNFFTNIVMVFPLLPVLIILAAIFERRSLLLVATIIGLVSWPWVARATRAQVLSLREREFVRLARISGEGSAKIALLEVMPYILAYVVMAFVLLVAGAIGSEAGISMIGLGPTEAVSLGNLLFWALAHEATRVGHWWTFLPPGLVITLLAVSSLILHRRMEQVFNPRLRTW